MAAGSAELGKRAGWEGSDAGESRLAAENRPLAGMECLSASKKSLEAGSEGSAANH